MAWSHNVTHGVTHDLSHGDGYVLTVVDVFGMYIIIILAPVPSYHHFTASRTITLSVIPTDPLLCSAFVLQGVIPSSPVRPTVGFSIQAIELFRVAHLRCPHLSQQAFIKTLSDLHTVQYQKHLSRQFSIAFDLYISIRAAVDNRVKKALGRDITDWRLQHTCPPCMHKLREEPSLIFSMLWAMDGCDTPKRILRRSSATDGDPSKPGPSCERIDTRRVGGDMYIPRDDVNKWARKEVEKVQSTSEAVSFLIIFYSTSLTDK
jgi:hypothetical protein